VKIAFGNEFYKLFFKENALIAQNLGRAENTSF